MYGRDRDTRIAPAREDLHREDWDDGWDAPERPRKGVFRRLFSLVKFAVFALPLAVFAYGSLFADCRSRTAFTGWTGLLGASACARSEIAGSALSMQDNFAFLKRLID